MAGLQRSFTLVVFLALSCTALVWPEGASGQSGSGVQVTPDEARTVVSKDVGTERWAITRNRADGSVTGNVFFPDGSAPQFVWCEELAVSGGNITLRCLGANRCPLAPCVADEWALIGEVTIGQSFFGPEVGQMVASKRSLATGAGAVEQRSSGVQVTADRSIDIVSKDVGAERWAITRNRADGSVTGNVFFPDGRDPQFVWCEQRSSGADIELSCFGAARCLAGMCSDQWSFISDVTIPESFFAASFQVSLERVVDAILVSLGDEAGSIATLLALDRGYSLRQVVRAGLSDRLQASGEISTNAGVAEVPENPAFGLFAAEASSAAQASESPVPISVRDVHRVLTGPREAVLALIFLLVSEGYDVEQISGLVLGVYELVLTGENRDEAVLLDTDGTVVYPNLRRPGFVRNPLPAPGEEDPLPWFFSGTTTNENNMSAADFESFSDSIRCSYSVTLQADGTIEGERTCPTLIQPVCPDPINREPGRFLLIDSNFVRSLAGTWQADGSFQLNDVSSSVAPFRGKFSATNVSAVRDLGRKQFTTCDRSVTTAVVTTLDLIRVVD